MKPASLFKSLLLALMGEPKKTRTSSKHTYSSPPDDPDDNAWFEFYDQEVLGESNYTPALLSIVGKYSRYGHRHSCAAVLVPEPDNPHDANAIRVTIEGQTVGYLPKRLAGNIAAGKVSIGTLPKTVKAGISGGARTNQYDAENFSVRLNLGLRAKRPAKS